MYDSGTVTISLREWETLQTDLAAKKHRITELEEKLKDRETFLLKYVDDAYRYTELIGYKSAERFSTKFQIRMQVPDYRFELDDLLLYHVNDPKELALLQMQWSEDMVRKWATRFALEMVETIKATIPPKTNKKEAYCKNPTTEW